MDDNIKKLSNILTNNLPDLSDIKTYNNLQSIPIITNLFRNIAKEKEFNFINFLYDFLKIIHQ